MTQEWQWRCVKLDPGEVFFLIAKFLEEGPCEKSAKALREELEEKKLLPKGKNWLGEEFVVDFEDVGKRNKHVTSDFLPFICKEFCTRLEESSDSRAKGKHSLIGYGSTKAIYGNKNKVQYENSLTRLAYERMKISSGHLQNSLSLNQSLLLAARKISPHYHHEIQKLDNYENMKNHRSVLGHLAPVFCVAFDTSGQRYISGADDDLVKVWSSRTGSLVATLRGHTAEITDLSVSRDNLTIATGSLDKTVRVWCGHTSAPLAVLSGHQGHVTSVQISPVIDSDIRYVASTAKDGCVCFWSYDESMTFSSSPIKFMEKNRVHDQTLCSAFSPGGTFFVTGGTDCLVRVYQCVPYPPVLIAELAGHTDRIMTVQFSNTPMCTFATGSCDGTCILWRYQWSKWASTRLVDCQVQKATPSVIATPATTYRSSGSGSKGDKQFPHQVTMIGWEVTDTYIVSAHTPDCYLRVWLAKDGRLVNTLQGHSGEVFVVECHPTDSRVLLTAGHDGKIFIWDIVANCKLRSFLLDYSCEGGVGLIFDCKWSPDGTMAIAADHLGYLTVFGFGSSELYEKIPDEQFFHTDYRPLMRDRGNFVVDEQSQLQPHLMPPPYLVDIDGHPHPLQQQESILSFVRPAKLSKERLQTDDIEDYDAYMKKHFASVKNCKRTAIKNRGGQWSSGKGTRVEEEHPQQTQLSEEGDDNSNKCPLVETKEETKNLPSTSNTNDTQQLPGQPLESKNNEEVVDVMEGGEEEKGEGGDNNIQNMLSSIVYSLGLGEDEVQEAVKNWHRREILPRLSTDVLCSDIALLRELEGRELSLYQLESQRQQENVMETTDEGKAESTQGRFLRSGRTIPEREMISEPPSPLSVGGDRYQNDGDFNELDWDSASTASSDISDWTAEAGVNWTTSSSKRSRRTKIRESLLSEAFSDGITIDEEEAANRNDSGSGQDESGSGQDERRSRKRKGRDLSSDEPQPKRKKSKALTTHVSKSFDYSVYWPTPWLKLATPRLSPYFPQVGDIVVYFRQGHTLYREGVKKEKAYQWKTQQMPWDKYNLKSQELCRVRNVHFVVGPPTLCSITLALLSPVSDSAPSPNTQPTNSAHSVTFTFKYHDMDDVLDFIVLEAVYKSSLKHQWREGDRFQSFIDGSYWKGTILSRKPYHDEFPHSHWQCYSVKWDDGATDGLSPWDMEPLPQPRPPTEDNEEEIQNDEITEGPRLIFPLTFEDEVTAWGAEGEKERIAQGLEVVMEKMEEAEMFITPVDIDEEYLYCSVVPFPTDLSTILEKMRNGFYRRKLALIWEVVALSRNALSYNEPSSLIVAHSKILIHTLLKFIRCPECTDPMEYYQQEVENGAESHQEEEDEVTAPDVEYLESEDVFPSLTPPPQTPPTSHPMTRRRKVLLSDDSVITNGATVCTWLDEATSLLDKMATSSCAHPFMTPVDTETYKDYRTFVQCPMDLTTIRNKLYDHEYLSPRDFISDIKLVFANARSYNYSSSKVYKMASELQKLFENEVLEFLQSCSNGTSSAHHYRTRRALDTLALASVSSTHRTSPSSGEDTADLFPWTREREEERDSACNSDYGYRRGKGGVAKTRLKKRRSNDGSRETESTKMPKMATKRSLRGKGNNSNEEDTDEFSDEGVCQGAGPIIRRSMRTRSSARRLMDREEEEGEGEDSDGSDDGSNAGTTEEEELSNEQEMDSFHPRRSLRIRSSVKYKREEEEEEESEGDTGSNYTGSDGYSISRTGRVIKPTLRYS